jgi:hypothetical protein
VKAHARLEATGRQLLFLAPLFAGLLFSAAIPTPLRGQDAPEQDPAKKQGADKDKPARENWRKEMVRRPLPRNGCFTANFRGWRWY